MQSLDQITTVKTIADRLKEERQARGLSQEGLAKAAKVSQGTIGNIESGARRRPRELLKIAGALKVRPEWLQNGEGPKHPSPSHADELSLPSSREAQTTVTLEQALPVVLEAIARATQRDKLRTALLAVLDDDAPAYRQRLGELLNEPASSSDDPATASTANTGNRRVA